MFLGQLELVDINPKRLDGREINKRFIGET